MLAYPKVDLSLDRLNQGGWAMGDLPVDRPEGRVWVVTGQRDKQPDYCPSSVTSGSPGGWPGVRLTGWKKQRPRRRRR